MPPPRLRLVLPRLLDASRRLVRPFVLAFGEFDTSGHKLSFRNQVALKPNPNQSISTAIGLDRLDFTLVNFGYIPFQAAGQFR
jgi:hypothetical protein